MNNNIDVSVYMLTYFHEKYLSRAIDSVLSQKTKYNLELVICDDCSTDDTKRIIENYKKKYPDIIRAYYNEQNIGIPKNIYKARCLCKGKYIVALSGDDYWIRNDKIEKQVSFLESNDAYIGVGNAMELRYDDDESAFDELPEKNKRNTSFTIKDYENGDIFYSHGFMIRNLFLNKEGRDYFKETQKISDFVDDAVDIVFILKKGNLYVMDLISDVYRVPRYKNDKHNYNSKFNRLQKIKNTVNILNNLKYYWGKSIKLKKKYIDLIPMMFFSAILDGNYKNYISIYKSIPIIYRRPLYNGILIKSMPLIPKFFFCTISKKMKNYLKNMIKL